MYSAVDKECQAQRTMKFLRIQFDFIRASVDNYHQRLPDFIEHMRSDIMDGFGKFLFELFQEAQKLPSKFRVQTLSSRTILLA